MSAEDLTGIIKPALLVLDGHEGHMYAFSTDGSQQRIVVANCGGTPDGIAVDTERKHIYWTNMGEHWDFNDGFIERVDFDGSNRTVIIPKGKTFTPKQLQLDLKNEKIYWCDREGMRVMCAGLDGSDITTLVQRGQGPEDRKDEARHCVGIALDVEGGYFYWSQKGAPKAGEGRIFRAPLNFPGGDPAQRRDIEILWAMLPEPIDLDLDNEKGILYWTDRGAEPDGNSLNRTSIKDDRFLRREVLTTGLQEAIGLALDLKNDTAYFGDLGGNIYRSALDGSQRTTIYSGGGLLTGIAYLEQGL
jgi:hypothetical protein